MVCVAVSALDDASTGTGRQPLDLPYLALFCSRRCPGSLIIRAQDLAYALRAAGVPVVGGFHTSVEKECLRVLLGGAGPLALVPARGMEGMRLPAVWRAPLAEGRLRLLSPFGPNERRVTAALSVARNRYVAELAAAVLVIYAHPGGGTETLCRELLAAGKPVYTLADPANALLVALGARRVQVGEPLDWLPIAPEVG